MGIAVISPILLFFILTALLYLPPVQNWAVQKVVTVASKQTGMTIAVERISLEWPLDLGVNGLRIIHPNDSLKGISDTIADVRKLVADVRLMPLLHKQVVVDELSFHSARINTNGFISDLRIKGDVGLLHVASRGIDLERELVEVNGAQLKDAHIDITLSDTAAVDTTTSEVRWRIKADSLSIEKSGVSVHLPGDTLNIKAWLGRVVAKDGDINLGKGYYHVGSFDWYDGRLTYDDSQAPDAPGLDFNHISLSHIRLGIDHLIYSTSGLSFFVRQTALQEKSGIAIVELDGDVRMDSTYRNIQLPQLVLRTPDSNIFAEADVDFSTFDNQNPGKLKVRLNAQLGKQDIVRFVGDLPQKFIERYPNHGMVVKGSVDGNMQHATFTGIDVNLPTAFRVRLTGSADNITKLTRLKADLKLDAEVHEANFLMALADPGLLDSYRIPHGMVANGTLKADGTKYSTNLTVSEGKGSVALKGNVGIPLNAAGRMDATAITYDADVHIDNFDVSHVMPKDSIGIITANVSANGFGTDIFDHTSRLTASATIDKLAYGKWNLDNVTADALLHKGRAQMNLRGYNDLFEGTVDADMLLSANRIDATVNADLAKADIFKMRLVEDSLVVGFSGNFAVSSDMKQRHIANGTFDNLYIKGERKFYRPGALDLQLRATRDTTHVLAQSGDFIVRLDADAGYERLLNEGTLLADSLKAQFSRRVINQSAIKAMLPTMQLHIESRRNNPAAQLLRTMNIDFRELFIDLNTSPLNGINGESHIYSLNYDSTRLDTIRLNLMHKRERLTYNGQICNNRRNPQFVFNALLDGHVHEHGALAGLRYYDEKGKMGVRIGATADMEENGIRFRLMPDHPTLGYKVFNLNKDNYIFLGKHNKIQAKVDLIADDRTGLKIYTEQQDPSMLQDITVSLNRLNLGEITSVFPYMPRLTGYLNGDFHILLDQQEHLSLASDMGVQDMTHEGSPIGNLNMELVYLQKENDTHAIETRLMLDDREFGLLSGSYQNKGDGAIDATFTMNRMPLSLINGFFPDQIIGLEGYSEGSVAIKGTPKRPQVNGEVYVDSAYLVSVPYGVRMRFDSDPLRIVDSKLLLENFGLYAYNDQPLVMMGNIDLSDISRITTDIRMQARNMQLIKAKQAAKSIAFGKGFINFFARLQGPVEQLNLRGKLDVLGSTDMTYMLLDSPLSTDNRLNELVKFTDFSDSAQVAVARPTPSGLGVDLTISVAQGARIVCNLNADQTNYIDLMGGGDLRMKYTPEGINLTGRYTLSSGEMKYSLPVIPLKTFNIQEGSYVEFRGDPLNPRLNITATERTRASVGSQDQGSRSVAFDCGVIITKTLKDMGLEFIINALEDNSIQGELSTMSKEERAKLAVSMLTTGMYLANDQTSGFSMNNALSSFLQNEINSITGAALKTLDLSVGIDNTTNSTGEMRTDYSFKFSKRLFNNRLKIQLGGKVSSDNTDNAPGSTQSFFDNVTMEYRLNQEGTMNVKLFYQQNVYDWLEGYTGVYGGGFIWRRKLDSLRDFFKVKKRNDEILPAK